MEETNELIRVWECPHCGIIIRNKRPNQCSCGRNNWMINLQVEGLIKRELQKATIKAKEETEMWKKKYYTAQKAFCEHDERVKQKIGEMK